MTTSRCLFLSNASLRPPTKFTQRRNSMSGSRLVNVGSSSRDCWTISTTITECRFVTITASFWKTSKSTAKNSLSSSWWGSAWTSPNLSISSACYTWWKTHTSTVSWAALPKEPIFLWSTNKDTWDFWTPIKQRKFLSSRGLKKSKPTSCLRFRGSRKIW